MGMYQGKPEKGYVQPIQFALNSFQDFLKERELPKIQDFMYMQTATNGFFVRSSITDGHYEAAVRLELVSAPGYAQKAWLIVDNYAQVTCAYLEEISAARGNVFAPWPDARWLDPAQIVVQACEQYVQENGQELMAKVGTPSMIGALQDFLGMLPWSPYLFHTEEPIYMAMSDEEEDILESLAAGHQHVDEPALAGDDTSEEDVDDQQISALCWTLMCGSQVYLTAYGATLQYKPTEQMNIYLRRKELSVFRHEIVTIAMH